MPPPLRFKAVLGLALALAGPVSPAEEDSLRVRVSLGHRAPRGSVHFVRFLPGSPGLAVSAPHGVGLEAGDEAGETSRLQAGAGDVDALDLEVRWTRPRSPARKVHSIWRYLLDHGSAGQVSRLVDDPGLIPDAPVLTVQLAEDGTRGFSVSLELLRRQGAIWVPGHDALVMLAEAPVDPGSHFASLTGERTLDRVKREPEATLEQFQSLWEDVGDPLVWNKPWETTWLGARGHLVVTAAAHGSLYKFAVDRAGRVRPDFASPHRFRLDPLWPGSSWVGQRITNGLPILLTTHERRGQVFQLEQFAARLGSEPPEKRGEPPGVFVNRLRISGAAGPVQAGFRLASEANERSLRWRSTGALLTAVDRETGSVWLVVEPGPGLRVEPSAAAGSDAGTDAQHPLEFTCGGDLEAGQTLELVVKLASPPVPADRVARLTDLDASRARASVVGYWEDWLAQGARFEVPERAVNDLFRANLWHALVLPRHRVGEQGEARIDLPYANTAYGQLNADWPINQGVYVDYLIYGLRGHWAVAEEEFHAMFQSQQQADGRIGGYANWGVYSPGHLYAIAQNYLLSQDRAGFERLLSPSLKTLDWCLDQVARARTPVGASGLIRAPLNDLTHAEREWAFPQAYFVAGLEAFGRALALHQHPRAAEVSRIAGSLRGDVERAFARGSVKSPVVRLADGTWGNYVPSDALTPRRLLEEWYPTDVDCGPLHLARLSAVDPRGWLTEAMLHDHEDNLFLNGWGAANEPVYNQQATVYLLRDEPEAAIRSFYSMMACAFSHGQLSPLEHRWAWGQYFGPPSTDGAWFELYRNMILRERDDGCLLVGQATPRAWLKEGRSIRVDRAPTQFGPVTLTVDSHVASGRIQATVELAGPSPPAALLVRLRHPDRTPIRVVTVNDRPWEDFDPAQEWVRIRLPAEPRYRIEARY